MCTRRPRTRIGARRTTCNGLNSITLKLQSPTTEYEHTKSEWIHAVVSRERLVQEPFARRNTERDGSMDGLVPAANRPGQSGRWEPARARRQNCVGQEPRGVRWPICRIEGSDRRLLSA